jgi:F420-0:gamma-glutamyl ligase
MSLSRLRSQLEYNSSVSDLNIRLRKTPVVLSDSKARNLRDEVARGIRDVCIGLSGCVLVLY